jgi:hypothetical protein
MELSEPSRIEAEGIAELELREDVLEALTFRIPARTRQLVKKAEAH